MKNLYLIMFHYARFSPVVLLLLLLASGGSVSAAIVQTDFMYFADDNKIEKPTVALKYFEKKSPDSPYDINMASKPFNVGNVDQHYWLYVKIKNNTENKITRFILAVLPYRQLLNIYTVDEEGVTQLIMKESVDSPFDKGNYQHRWQVSTPFSIDAQQSVNVLVQYHAMGSSYLPLDIIDELSLIHIINDDKVSAALFYSFSVAAIFLFLLFGVAMQDKTSILYAMLFLVALLMLSAMEGFAFMYLWPDFPRWNHFSSLVLIYIFCALGFYVAYKAVEPSQQLQTVSLKARQCFLSLSAVSLLMVVMLVFLPFVLMVDLTNLFVALMFIAQAYAIVGWSRANSARLLKRNVIAIVSAVLIAVAVLVLVLLSFKVDLLPAYFYVHSSRIIFALAGLATMATIISHVSGLRQDYAVALENEVAAARREADINRELYEAEQEYARIKALASLSQRKLAAASHDMRQPLISLRSTIDAITHEQSPALKTQLANAFSYLENLCTTYLIETRPDKVFDELQRVDDMQAEGAQAVAEEKPYEISLILDTVKRMFEEEASAKGICLRVSPCSLCITQSPTVMMRITANLVSNAIKHSAGNKILLGVRRTRGSLAITVIDNGVGMSAAVQQSIMQAYEKGPESSGEGLGLAICKQLAEQSGLQLEITSVEGRGTCFLLRFSPLS